MTAYTRPGGDVGENVRAQYEQYPYPHHPVETIPEALPVAACYTLAQYARERRLAVPDGKRALIAGCGTGFELHSTAAFNDGFAEVVGVDFSNASLEVAKRRIAHHGLKNCRVQWGDLLKPETLPEGPFDYIGSHGVLHHLADPEAGLRNVADRLAPGGVMAVMLYNAAGRWPLYQARQALKLLGLDQAPLAEAVPVVRQMIKDAQPGSLFHLITTGEHNAAYYAHDTNLVDNLLHASDRPFHVGELPGYLEQAGLELVSMADEYRWRLATTIHPGCKPFYERVAKLRGVEQLQVIEGLNPFNNTEMIFWACRKGEATDDFGFDRSGFVGAKWQVNPLFVREAVVRSEVHGGQELKVAEWPLFFPQRKAAWPARWQHTLLESAWGEAKSGAEILGLAPNEGEALKWCASWERDRVLLRV